MEIYRCNLRGEGRTDRAIALLNQNSKASYSDKVKIVNRFSEVNAVRNHLEFMKIYLALKRVRVLNLTLG